MYIQHCYSEHTIVLTLSQGVSAEFIITAWQGSMHRAKFTAVCSESGLQWGHRCHRSLCQKYPRIMMHQDFELNSSCYTFRNFDIYHFFFPFLIGAPTQGIGVTSFRAGLPFVKGVSGNTLTDASRVVS